MVLQYLTSLVEEGNTVHKHICVVDWAYHLNLPTSLLYSNEDAHTTDKNVKILDPITLRTMATPRSKSLRTGARIQM